MNEKYDYVWVFVRNSTKTFAEAGAINEVQEITRKMTRMEADMENANAWARGTGGIMVWVRKEIIDALRTGNIGTIISEIRQIAISEHEEDERLGI